jgi:hypothetical protein
LNKINLATGIIIGVCNLINCLSLTEDNQGNTVLEDGRIILDIEYSLGDLW